MQNDVIETADAPPAIGPYVQAKCVAGFVFVSGQLPINPGTGAFPDGVEAQTQQSLDNLAAILRASGGSLSSVVKTTVFLKNMEDFARMNEVYATSFKDGAPARSTVEVARLPRDALVEIEAVAYIGNQ